MHMLNDILLYAGSALIIAWGIAHIIPTRNVVSGFGQLSEDNERIITMEWVAEGLALCFIGLLVLFVTVLGDSQNDASLIVYRASAGMLIIMAIWTGLTGARTAIIPIKICPFVKTLVAILFILGSVL
jgi:hypothetical protein